MKRNAEAKTFNVIWKQVMKLGDGGIFFIVL